MAAARQGKQTASIIATADPATALAALCPDLEQWPQRWRFDDSDLPFGRHLVACFIPFLLDLIAQQYTRKTLARHRDHLWMLGGDIIRRGQEEPKLRRQSVERVVLELIDDEGGPLIWPSISEAEQIAFDSTCRKLHKFLTAQLAARNSS